MPTRLPFFLTIGTIAIMHGGLCLSSLRDTSRLWDGVKALGYAHGLWVMYEYMGYVGARMAHRRMDSIARRMHGTHRRDGEELGSWKFPFHF